MMLDMDSYTTYRSSVISNIRSQTISIPTTQSRAKAVFSIPRLQNDASWKVAGTGDWQENGQWSDLKEYRSQIDGQFYPNQPVDLAQFSGNWHFPQMHVRELEKAFDAAGVPFVSIDALKQNFVIGRALSSYGSSTNLTGTPINLYLEYNTAGGPGKTLDMVSFLHHTIRVVVTPMGVEVLV